MIDDGEVGRDEAEEIIREQVTKASPSPAKCLSFVSKNSVESFKIRK